MNDKHLKNKTEKVLIAEDDIVSAKILEKNIRDWGYEVVLANNGEKAWDLFNKNEMRLVILDWMMPKISGITLCRKIRQKKKDKYVYIILLTSKDNPEDLLKGFLAGADDYITKPFNSLELKARLQTGKRIIDLQRQLREQATRDGLTGLLNRKAILQALEEELHKGLRENKPVTSMLLDIDHFKKANDTHGHNVGDAVLIEIANRLKKSFRPYDKIGRYGGDEFLLILPNCGILEARKIAERIRSAVCREKINTDVGPLSITISLGGATSESQPQISAKNLIQNSDKALYNAKNNGRNCTLFDEIDQSLRYSQ